MRVIKGKKEYEKCDKGNEKYEFDEGWKILSVDGVGMFSDAVRAGSKSVSHNGTLFDEF